MPDVSKRAVKPPPKPDLIPRWLIITVVVVVLVVWCASIAYSAKNPDWPIPSSVHGVTILVLTAVTGAMALTRK